MQEAILTQLTAPGGGRPLRVAVVGAREGPEIIEGAALSSSQGLFPIREGILDLLPRGPGRVNPAQMTNFFSLTARGYERPWRSRSLTLLSGESLGFEREEAILSEMLGPPRPGLWLDLAASTALYARWWAPRLRDSGSVVALDFSWAMSREGRRRAREEGHPNLGFVVGRAEHLPAADQSVAGVLCGGSLNEFGRRGAARAAAEVARVLEVDGAALFMYLLAAEGTVGSLVQQVLSRSSGIAFWRPEEGEQLFAQAGLTVTEQRQFGIVAFARVERSA